MRILLKAKHVYAPGVADADTLLIENGLISWVGAHSAIKNLALSFDYEVDVSDHFVCPAFVDSHVHLSATGAQLTGLDLSQAKTAVEAIGQLKQFVATNQSKFIIGHGWEDTDWPDANLWNFDNVKEIVGEKNLYLSRIDVHSALVKTPVTSGIVKQEEHHKVRDYVQNNLPATQRREQIKAALQLAAKNGIVSVHENAGPHVSGQADFLDVLDLARDELSPIVFAYWGSTDLNEVKQLGAYGAAGDLTVDGSIGSKTAYLCEPYEDSSDVGTLFLSSDQVAGHLVACTKARIQGGFHAIGDGALAEIVIGINKAIDQVGMSALRLNKHRIEHAEMLNPSALELLAKCGIVLSMQPVFDELWGSKGGLYERRLGKQRVAQMNSFNAIAKAGVGMAFSSDSPVTPIDPWRAIKAATDHHTKGHRISARAAFAAHTRGGWRAAGDDHNGVIAEGLPANIAIWSVDNYTIKIPDERVRAWSTDVRSGTPPLPDLSEKFPKCLATIKSGKAIYDPDKIWPS